jgi:hypothetical protein
MLRFTPTAWAKLLFLRDFGNTEVGGFGIAAEDDPLLILDFQLVRQSCSVVTVKFDDEAVADFFDEQVDAGLTPESFFRTWIHTHPGDCAQPSGVDEATFARVFGSADWAIMFIIAEGGETFARLRFNVGPNAEMLIPVEVDYSQPFSGSDYAAWTAEYEANVNEEPQLVLGNKHRQSVLEPLSDSPFAPADDELDAEWHDSWWEYIDESAPAMEVL